MSHRGRNASACAPLQLDASLPEMLRWRGLRPLAEDGTFAQIAEPPANREFWHGPSGEEECCGFPVVRLSTGSSMGVTEGVRDFACSILET